MRSTFKILFYFKKNSPKPNGTAPLMCKITIDGTISQFSCKKDVPPNQWDTKVGRLTGKNAVAVKTNIALNKIRVDINRHYQDVM
jgi:hypothetical protein